MSSQIKLIKILKQEEKAALKKFRKLNNKKVRQSKDATNSTYKKIYNQNPRDNTLA